MLGVFENKVLQRNITGEEVVRGVENFVNGSFVPCTIEVIHKSLISNTTMGSVYVELIIICEMHVEFRRKT
jgi:hypothetical protein